jgi:LEA14-like dessication related protein
MTDPSRRLVLAALPGFALTLAGCPKIPQGTAKKLKKYLPSVRFDKVKVRNINFDKADLDFVFQVDNPLPLKVGLASLTYKLALEEVDFLSGKDPDGLNLKAQGSSAMPLPLTLRWKKAAELLSATKGKDELGFGLSGKLGFNTPAGVATLPYSAGGQVPALRRPRFRFQGLRLKDLQLAQDRARLALDLGITNLGGATIGLHDFAYRFKIGDKRVAKGNTGELAKVAGDTEETVSLPIDITLSKLGASALDALRSRGKVQAGLAADLGVSTPFGRVPLSIDESGRLSVG